MVLVAMEAAAPREQPRAAAVKGAQHGCALYEIKRKERKERQGKKRKKEKGKSGCEFGKR